MVVIVVCSALFLVGLVLIIVLGGKPVEPPHQQKSPNRLQDPYRVEHQLAALRLYAWWATVLSVTAFASGILIAGAGGRIAMRVLALTSPNAVGRITEAQATVGNITVGGTVALFIFGGLFAGYLSAGLYLLIHRWLPRGRLGGAAFGLLLLIVFGAVLDPLRAGNIDFAIVGPGWLSVLLFSALSILHGMLIAAVAGWYGSRLPAYSSHNRRAYWPLLASVVFPAGGLLLGAGAVVVMVGARIMPSGSQWWASRPVLWFGRGVLALSVVLSLPIFTDSLVHIAQRI